MDAVSFQHKTMGQDAQPVDFKEFWKILLYGTPLLQSDSGFMCPQPQLNLTCKGVDVAVKKGPAESTRANRNRFAAGWQALFKSL